MHTCVLGRGSTSGLVRTIFISKHSRPSRGAKPCEADDTRLPRGKPHQAGSRGAERSRRGAPREVPVTQATMTVRQAGAIARSVLLSSLVLKRQAQMRSLDASGKGFHIGAMRPRPAGWRSPWSPRRCHHQSLWQAKNTFSQDSLYNCPLSNWPLLAPFRLNIWEEDQNLYK